MCRMPVKKQRTNANHFLNPAKVSVFNVISLNTLNVPARCYSTGMNSLGTSIPISFK